MSEYVATYTPADDVLRIRLVGSGDLGDTHTVRTSRDLELLTNEDEDALLGVTVNDFSRRVNFVDLYDIFGGTFVRRLAEIQSTLNAEEARAISRQDPMRSPGRRRQLIDA